MLQLLNNPNPVAALEGYGTEPPISRQPKAPREAGVRRVTRVRITSPVGFEVSGELKSISRAGIQVLTSVAVPIRCPLEIAIAGCRPFDAEAFYCLVRSDGHQVGLVFASMVRPRLELGALASIQELGLAGRVTRGSVVDVGRSSVSILCKTALAPSTEIRLESAGWVLFGAVRTVVPTSMISKCMEIHLHAAFQAAPDETAGEGTDSRVEARGEGDQQ